MKKFIYAIGIIAASALTFTACRKDVNALPYNNLVTISFTAEKAGFDTKTAAVEGTDEVSYIWTDSDIDNIKLFTVSTDGNGKEKLTAVSPVNATKVSDTKLTISGQVAPGVTYTFRAVLSGKWTSGKNPRLSDIQSPNITNFDPATDVLVSKDIVVEVPASEESKVATEALEMQFRRLIVVNKMTLKNIDAGEKVRKVVITSDNNLSGYFSTESGSASGDNKVITLNYSGVSVPEDGLFPVYFTSIPGTGHSLTVEVTTDNYVYTKSFAEGKTIDFNAGQFTKFNVALPAGVANASLSLPVEDDMAWADNGSADGNKLKADEITAAQGTKKIYNSVSTAYMGKGGIKLGSSNDRGEITTNGIDLSSAFHIAIDAKTWTNDGTGKADNSRLEIQVDGTKVYESPALTTDFETYYVNCNPANANSTITIKINGKRGYIKNLAVKAGTYVAVPTIKVSSDNPMSVAGLGGVYSISYSIENPTEATINAETTDSWITDIDHSTGGTVSFKVAAQDDGAEARIGSITLKYAGAEDVVVYVNQREGGSAAVTKTFTVRSNDIVNNSAYKAYETSDWIITFGGNNKSIGTNSKNRNNCTLSSYSKYAVSPITNSSIASAFANTTALSNVSKISYTIGAGANQNSTEVYLLYSTDGTDFSQMNLTKGTQGHKIETGTEFEFAECSGYFAVLFVATNSSGNWRIDDVELTFTYTE